MPQEQQQTQQQQAIATHYAPVYPMLPPAPATLPAPAQRWGATPFDYIMCGIVGAALAAVMTWLIADSFYGGQDIRQLEAERSSALKQGEVYRSQMEQAREVLGCR